MKIVTLALLMLAAPILNIAGLVELKTLSAIGIGFAISQVIAKLPDGLTRRIRPSQG